MTGQEIIAAVSARRGVSLEGIRGKRSRAMSAVSAARREAVHEMIAAGLGYKEIADHLGISVPGVAYYLEDVRNDGFMSYFPPDLRRWVLQLARLHGVKPITIAMERFREMAEHERIDVERGG